MNGKGGVGKSTLALGLCAYAAQTHGAGLLVDCDPQGTSYEITGLLADPGYDVVHELDASQFDKIRQVRGYDLIVVDCPGSQEGHDELAPVLWPAPTFVVSFREHRPGLLTVAGHHGPVRISTGRANSRRGQGGSARASFRTGSVAAWRCRS